jgi:beta-glucosidase
LSYTSFSYNNLRVSDSTFRDIDGLTVMVDITNTGQVAGKETVQVYVNDQHSSLVRPPKELKGFAKIELQPGETKTVHIPLDYRSFAFYHPAYQQWITEDGDYELLIGASSADIRCRQTVTLQSTLDLPCILNNESTIREWLDDPRGKTILMPMLEQIGMQRFQELGDEAADIGMDMITFMLDMPLPSILHFQENILAEPVEAIMKDLLARVHGPQVQDDNRSDTGF